MRIQDLFADLLLENEQRSRQMIKRYGAQIEPRLLNELPAFQDEAKQGEGETVPEQVINYHLTASAPTRATLKRAWWGV